MSVSREKYEKSKSKSVYWHKKAMEFMTKTDNLLELNVSLEKEVEKLQKENKEFLSKTEKLQKENVLLRKENDSKKTDSLQLQTLREKISNLERDIILRDGKIQQLEETRRDLKERYNELKEDFRDQQRWLREQNRNRGKEVSSK